MNLIFRMLALLIASYFKPRLPVENPKNSLVLRVLPNDIDLNLHMNNSRYLTICDLIRVDLFVRTGLVSAMMSEKWMPVICELTMKYKKPLKLFQQYEVQLQVVGWNEKTFEMQHTFIVGDKIIAEGTSQGLILSKNGVIPPAEVMRTVAERSKFKKV